ncbi:hypothetical protein L198_07029 [Cryptococcus wingfieldii CBS 7118]|uniref:Uncharacterized protein n=1 Tax=Cryptococcus wingfieldii CBS 7118 TaxID=1295528 RepID=A0A1E3IG53_9TREE|nr:hypothetical protein L198_07029 [Cryptococcus wingfieldii CBS 7118]ODN87405.1 hypothetical protein L198_07029 [Cryptococcus wingfieldii CBS 7118]
MSNRNEETVLARSYADPSAPFTEGPPDPSNPFFSSIIRGTQTSLYWNYNQQTESYTIKIPAFIGPKGSRGTFNYLEGESKAAHSTLLDEEWCSRVTWANGRSLKEEVEKRFPSLSERQTDAFMSEVETRLAALKHIVINSPTHPMGAEGISNSKE